MASGMDSASWDRRYDGSELVWTAEPNRFLVAETETLAPGRAIDLACGEGRNAVWLAERGWQAVGADFSEVGLRKARELADSRGVTVEWVAADLLDYHPDPRAFDLVLVFYLQVPASERRPIFRAAVDAVAPGGTFLVVAHDSSNPPARTRRPAGPRRALHRGRRRLRHRRARAAHRAGRACGTARTDADRRAPSAGRARPGPPLRVTANDDLV